MGIRQLHLAVGSISSSLFLVSSGSDVVYMTLTTAADFQSDKKGLARLCKGLNVRGVWSSQADSVAPQSQVSVSFRCVNWLYSDRILLKSCIFNLIFNVLHLTSPNCMGQIIYCTAYKLLETHIYNTVCQSASDSITQLPFWRFKGFCRRQTHLVSSHSSSHMLLYTDQGSCTFPYQSTVLDIRDVEPCCICFRAGFNPTDWYHFDPKCFGIGCKRLSCKFYLSTYVMYKLPGL